MNKQLLLCLMLGGILSGCASGPQTAFHEQPEVPAHFQAEAKPGASADALADNWWTTMHDDGLTRMIEAAFSNSPVVPMALARIKRARAELSGAEGEMKPQVGAFASTSYDHTSKTTPTGEMLGNESVRGHTHALGLQASWEPDLWGRLSGQASIGRLGLEMSNIDAESVRLMLAADVAATYFRCRAAQAELDILVQTRTQRLGQIDILESRFKAGLVNELDVVRTRVELANTQADMAETQRRLAASERALQALMGVADFDPYRGYCEASADLPRPMQIDAGVPAQLLGRRPDLAKSALRLSQLLQKEQIARTAYYPSISLVGSFGYASSEMKELLKGSSSQFSIGPLAVYLPIFEGGRIASRIDTARAEYEEDYAQHRQLLLNALRDVDDALNDMKYQDLQLTERQAAADAAARVVDLARARYGKGLVSYLEVIDAERNLLASQRGAVQSKAALLASNIGLIRALGGGWGGAVKEAAK